MIIGSDATKTSGVPESWAAHRDRPGVWLIRDPATRSTADDVVARVLALKRTGDVAIVSLHWGSNWGYGVGLSEIQFAHRLVDAGIDSGRGEVAALRMLPLRVRRMRLERVSETDAQWPRATMEHISRRFEIDVAAVSDELLTVHPRR